MQGRKQRKLQRVRAMAAAGAGGRNCPLLQSPLRSPARRSRLQQRHWTAAKKMKMMMQKQTSPWKARPAQIVEHSFY